MASPPTDSGYPAEQPGLARLPSDAVKAPETPELARLTSATATSPKAPEDDEVVKLLESAGFPAERCGELALKLVMQGVSGVKELAIMSGAPMGKDPDLLVKSEVLKEGEQDMARKAFELAVAARPEALAEWEEMRAKKASGGETPALARLTSSSAMSFEVPKSDEVVAMLRNAGFVEARVHALAVSLARQGVGDVKALAGMLGSPVGRKPQMLVTCRILKDGEVPTFTKAMELAAVEFPEAPARWEKSAASSAPPPLDRATSAKSDEVIKLFTDAGATLERASVVALTLSRQGVNSAKDLAIMSGNPVGKKPALLVECKVLDEGEEDMFRKVLEAAVSVCPGAFEEWQQNRAKKKAAGGQTPAYARMPSFSMPNETASDAVVKILKEAGFSNQRAPLLALALAKQGIRSAKEFAIANAMPVGKKPDLLVRVNILKEGEQDMFSKALELALAECPDAPAEWQASREKTPASAA